MPTLNFTYALKRFFPGLEKATTSGRDLREILDELESRYPRFKSYILDEQGGLRKHVNIFIDGNMISDRKNLTDTFNEQSEIYIMQALSGG